MKSNREFQLVVCSTLTVNVILCFINQVEMDFKSILIKSRDIPFSPLLIRVDSLGVKLIIT